MTLPLHPLDKAARAEARKAAQRPALMTDEELNEAFMLTPAGDIMVYYTGESLARECRDWERDKVLGRAERAQHVREWALDKHRFKRGFLAQRKHGDVYEYTITKAKLYNHQPERTTK